MLAYTSDMQWNAIYSRECILTCGSKVLFILHKLRGHVSDAIIAFGRVVLFLLSLFLFALAEREKEQQKWMRTLLPQAITNVKQATA